MRRLSLLLITVGVALCALVGSAAGATSRPAKASRVLYSQSGTRSATTKPITLPRTWTLTWSFDCAKSPLGEGSFVVTVHPVTGNDVGAAEGSKIDESGPSGSGQQVYNTAGRKTLVIVALCPWKLKVLRGAA